MKTKNPFRYLQVLALVLFLVLAFVLARISSQNVLRSFLPVKASGSLCTTLYSSKAQCQRPDYPCDGGYVNTGDCPTFAYGSFPVTGKCCTQSCVVGLNQCPSGYICNDADLLGLNDKVGRCTLPWKGPAGSCRGLVDTAKCKVSTTTSCNGGYVDGYCPNGGNYKCCLPTTTSCAKTFTYTSNNSTKYAKCQTVGGSQTCRAGYVGGYCPGPANVKCCVPRYTASWLKSYNGTVNLDLSDPALADIIYTIRYPKDTNCYEGNCAVDKKMIEMIGTLSQKYRIGVWNFKTGHSKYIAGSSRISQHYLGKASDIGVVNGSSVYYGNSAAYNLIVWLTTMRGALVPSHVGSPWSYPSTNGISYFTNWAHKDHIHIDYD